MGTIRFSLMEANRFTDVIAVVHYQQKNLQRKVENMAYVV
jgi:hypothetical protein